MNTTAPVVIEGKRKRWTLLSLLSLYRAWRAQRKALAAEQAFTRAEVKRRREMYAMLVDEAYFYIDRMKGVSQRMDELCYRYKKSERDLLTGGVKTIDFADMVLQPEAIYLRVDTTRLPRNVSVLSLSNEETLFNMSLACRHQVLCEHDPEKGFWYIIERTSGVRGIPIHVRLDEMWSARPSTADGLSIPYGIGANKAPVWKSLTSQLSLLVAGEPGTGKSNMLNTILCTFIRFNSPKRLKLALVDLKGGVEFGDYAEVPHLMRYTPLPHAKGDPLEPEEDEQTPAETAEDAVEQSDEPKSTRVHALVERREDVLPLLRALYKEGRRRIKLLRQAGPGNKNISAYNWKHRNTAMPHLVLMIDELAELRILPEGEFTKVMQLLVSMAQLFRAVGIHIIMATQTVKANIVTTEVKNAMPAALAFACKNATASIMIVGDGSAVGLHPVGRCIMDWGGQQKELQSPLINDKMIAQIIEGARDGQWEEQELSRHDVTDLDIFRASLEAFEGRLSVDPLFNHFRQNQRPIPRGELLNIITSYYDKEVVVDGILFKVMRGDNHHPNRMVAVEEEPELEG